jgi:hypothetical protein
MLKHTVLCEHTHITIKGGYKRNFLNEGWCQCLALDEKGGIL